MRYVYTLLLYLIMPWAVLRLCWRSRRLPAYRRRIAERFGYYTDVGVPRSIWLHAVSLGEVICAAPLIDALLQQYPNHPLVVTTMTPTGSAEVLRRFKGRVLHVYVPYDLSPIIKRFFKHFNPSLAIIMETELWPNILSQCQVKKIKVLLANARLSARSARNYQRFQWFFKPVLNCINLIAAQSEYDAKRFLQLGAQTDRVVVAGNLKFNLDLPKDLLTSAKNLRQSWGEERVIWIAASTHEGEEAIILDVFAKLIKNNPKLLLLLVPRHPERFDKVANLCQSSGFNYLLRSSQQPPTETAQVIVGDTMGELRLLYAVSDIALVGGSLVPVGGHNLLEPAAVGVPVISGHHLENFQAIKELLLDAHALRIVQNAEELHAYLEEMINNPSLRRQRGQQAKQVVVENAGALKTCVAWVVKQLQACH